MMKELLTTGELFGKIQVRLRASVAREGLYEKMNLLLDLDVKNQGTKGSKAWAQYTSFLSENSAI
jgi:hypothetical protein